MGGTVFDVDELILSAAELALIEDPFLPARERVYADEPWTWDRCLELTPWDLSAHANMVRSNYQRPMFEVLPDVDCGNFEGDGHDDCLGYDGWRSWEASIGPAPTLSQSPLSQYVTMNLSFDASAYRDAMLRLIERMGSFQRPTVQVLEYPQGAGTTADPYPHYRPRVVLGLGHTFARAWLDEWAPARPTGLAGIVDGWDVGETDLARTGDLPLDLTGSPEPAGGLLGPLTPSLASVWSSEPSRPVREPFAHRGRS